MSRPRRRGAQPWDPERVEVTIGGRPVRGLDSDAPTLPEPVPGYITLQNTSTSVGGAGGVLSLKQCRFKASSAPAGAVGGSGVIRVTGHARVRWEDIVGATGARVNDQVQDI